MREYAYLAWIPALVGLILGALAYFAPPRPVYGYDSTQPLVFVIKNPPCVASPAPDKDAAASDKPACTFNPLQVTPEVLAQNIEQAAHTVTWRVLADDHYRFTKGSIEFPSSGVKQEGKRDDDDPQYVCDEPPSADFLHFTCKYKGTRASFYKYKITVVDTALTVDGKPCAPSATAPVPPACTLTLDPTAGGDH